MQPVKAIHSMRPQPPAVVAHLVSDGGYAVGACTQVLSTPKNSERQGIVMMPRSSRSMRNTVTLSRDCEQPVPAPALAPGSPAMSPTNVQLSSSSIWVAATPSQRRPGLNISLGTEDAQTSIERWTGAAMSTPKNIDRRDMSGSVLLGTPLWRGSAAATAPSFAQVPQTPTEAKRPSAPAYAEVSTPSNGSVTFARRQCAEITMDTDTAEAASPTNSGPGIAPTPTNASRSTPSGGCVRLMMPRSSRSIRYVMQEFHSSEAPAPGPALVPCPPQEARYVRPVSRGGLKAVTVMSPCGPSGPVPTFVAAAPSACN